MKICNAYLTEWVKGVRSGKIHSSREIKWLVALLDGELDNPDIELRQDDVESCIRFIEEYFFPLFLEQKVIITLMVGLYWKATGFLVFDQIFIMAGRGFGKNGLISGIAAWFLSLQGVSNYNVDIVATAEEQAKTSFEEVHEMIDDLPPAKQKQWKYNLEIIEHKKTRSKLRYRTSNAKTKDGGRPGAVIFDEIHAYENYDDVKVFTGGLGKVDRPRRIYITTDGEIRDGLIDDYKERSRRILTGEEPHKGFLPIIFKLDTLQEVGKPYLWDKANPRLNHAPTLLHQVTQEYDEMLSNEKLKEAFITKRMNIPYISKEVTVADWEDIVATKDHPMEYSKGTLCQGSLDYADIRDFASAGIRWKQNGKHYFLQHTWIHEESLKLTKYNIDIDECVEKGWATIVKTKDYPTIHPKLMAEWFIEQRKTYNVLPEIKCDMFRATLIKDEFEKYGLKIKVVRSGSVTHNLVAPLIQGMLRERSLVMPDDKLMRWYITNVRVSTDKRGNRSFEKIEPIKRKTDGFFCLLHSLYDDQLKEQSQAVQFFDVVTF